MRSVSCVDMEGMGLGDSAVILMSVRSWIDLHVVYLIRIHR